MIGAFRFSTARSFMTSTYHLALPLLAAAQAQKHVTHNEALASLDGLVHLSVKERGRTVPPGTPEEGERYLVGAGATGSFLGHDGEVALFDLGTWRFFTPRPGWLMHVAAEGALVVFDGAQWRDLGHYCRLIESLDRLGIGTAADDLNRLSAKLNAALFAAITAEEGGSGDLRFILNKGASDNVLSQLYQKGFSGRAETGLIGSDDFSIRVSPDGAQWRDALVVDAKSGVAFFPQGLSNVPGANLLINADFRINQRGFSGGSLAPGAYGFDRWKAGPGGCTISRAANGMITLSGALEQVIDVTHAAALAGSADLSGASLTLSVQDLSAPLAVLIGTQAATLPSGSGRRSVTVTLDGSETGHVTVRLQAGSVCSFRKVKLEIGSAATPWVGEPLDLEEFRCRRYYQLLPGAGAAPAILGALGQRAAGTFIDIPCTLPVPMRAAPTLVTSGPVWVGGTPSGNQIAFYNMAGAAWTALSGTLTVTTAGPASPSAAILRLVASSSFSGVSGAAGQLYLGGQAFIAMQAEL